MSFSFGLLVSIDVFFWSALRTLRIYRSLFSSSPFCAFNNSRATVVTAIASRPLLLLLSYVCVCVCVCVLVLTGCD